MKRHITYAALLLCTALAVASCSGESADGDSAAGTGMLEMNISTTRAEADGEYDPKDHLVARIYNSRSELIRKYTSETYVKQLELIAGEYRIAVEAGEIVPASFTKRFYKGEETFTVNPGQTTVAEVKCTRQNTAAEVKFDASVTESFGTDFHFWIVADDTFDEEKAEQETVPALKYTSDATGYFTLPEGVTTFVWHFEGTHADRGEIVMEGRQENIQAGVKYVFTCLFSKDRPGSIQCVVIKVDTSSDEQDDTIVFSPSPTIEGDGFDISQPQGFIPGETWTRTYKLAAMAPLKTAELRFGEQTYDLLGDLPEGITAVRDNDLSLTVTLSETFFAGCSAGSHSAAFHVTDSKDAGTTVASELRVQGMLPVESSDYDLWSNAVTLRAMVADPDVTTVTFGLKNGEAWQDMAGTTDGSGYYTATYKPEWTESTNDAGLTVYTPAAGTGIAAGKSYESRVVLDGGTTYTTAAFTTAEGQSIPDGSMDNSSLSCFGTGNTTTTTWGSGNNSMKKGLCTQTSFDSATCAKLTASETMGNLAAGNLFFGTFVFSGLTGPGTVGFGQKYEYTARPKALKVKYHATVGKVDINKHKGPLAIGEDDFSQIFVCIVDWSARREVVSGMNTSDLKGIWNPADQTNLEGSGSIIAYGILPIRESTEGSSLVPAEIPLLFYDKEAPAPTGKFTLVISCSTSAYGDYMDGCSKNVMYVDDFEWVY